MTTIARSLQELRLTERKTERADAIRARITVFSVAAGFCLGLMLGMLVWRM